MGTGSVVLLAWRRSVNISNYINDALDQFKRDPADSDFQRGYLSCLLELARVFKLAPVTRDLLDQVNEEVETGDDD